VLLLSGKLLTGRDAAHKRMTDMLSRGEKLPVDFNRPLHLLRRPGRSRPRRSRRPRRPHHRHAHGQVHPPDARRDRPARHDRQSRARPRRHRSHREFGAVYLMAVGGAAYLVSKAIKARACWPSKTSAWKPSTSSTSSTCRSPSPSTPKAPASTTPAPPSGSSASLRSGCRSLGAARLSAQFWSLYTKARGNGEN
jgi:hypothetical protein